MPVLVATDLDNTFAVGGTVPPAHSRAVRQLQDSGVGVLAATGRRHRSAVRLLDSAGVRMPVVSVNGALGHTAYGSVFHRRVFDTELASAALELFCEFGLDPLCMVDHPDHDVWTSTPATHWYDWDDADPTLALCQVLGLDWSAPGMPGLFAATATTASPAARELAARMREFGEVALVAASSDCSFVDVTPAGVDKATGVAAWCATLDAAPLVVAVGDAGNDVAMLEAADVAVGVAGSEVLGLCDVDVVIDAPCDGGWVQLCHIAAELA